MIAKTRSAAPVESDCLVDSDQEQLAAIPATIAGIAPSNDIDAVGQLHERLKIKQRTSNAH